MYLLLKEHTLIFAPFALAVVGAFWIFVLWVLWIISQSLKGVNESLKVIAANSQK
jgi:flagellar biosynthesis protein FliQ